MVNSQSIWIIVGTRPECIKQAPLYKALVGQSKISIKLVGTGQHRELLESALSSYNLSLDLSFQSMLEQQNLPELMASVLLGFQKIIREHGRPCWVVVQGDTTTALAVSIAAFQMGIRVAHNEAGLRTFDYKNPFPEESNRRIITTLASLHFAPTKKAKENILREGVSSKRIHLVGNTGIDSLFWALKLELPDQVKKIIQEARARDMKLCLLTAHRRESAGKFFKEIFLGLKSFVEKHPEYWFVYPTHPNELGSVAANSVLGRNSRNLKMVSPFDYISLVHLLKNSEFVLTDSGGIQEEAATIGCPTVICRSITERPEAVDIGIARVAGLQKKTVLESLEWAASWERKNIIWEHRPFGEGYAGDRIASILLDSIDLDN